MHVLMYYLMLCKRHKWTLILSTVLSVLTLLVNIGLLTVSGWFLAASSIAGMFGYEFNYMLPAVSIRGAAIFRIVGRYFERVLGHDVTFRILQQLRVDTFKKLLSIFPSGLINFRQGDILDRIVSDVDTLDHFYLRVILPLFNAFTIITVVTFGLSIFDIILSIVFGSIMLLTLCVLAPLFYYIGKPIGKDLTHLRGKYYQQITSWLQNQEEFTIFGVNLYHRNEMKDTELDWYEIQRRHFDLHALSQAVMMLIGGLTVLIVLWIISEKSFSNSYKFGSLIALFTFCSLSSFEAVAPVANAFQNLGWTTAAAMRINQILGRKPKVNFKNDLCLNIPMRVTLCLYRVSFSYREQMQNVLKEITFSIEEGEHIAILGRNGCGKSTLIHLITRTWDPQEGIITLNGISLNQFSEKTLRAIISVVPQRTYLFSATLRENLLLHSCKKSDKTLYSILDHVNLNDLTESNGLDSWLGEGGRQLSGGELRRLAIARALLHDAPLVLLDEPTEGLDAVMEIRILELLEKIMRYKTLLVVTHRLRKLSYFDKIIIMDNGQILEQGSHEELLKKKGFYHHLQSACRLY